MHELYESFARFDTDSKGYLDLDDFTNYFEGDEPNFVELPYLEHFFILVHKQRPNQIFFEEFVASVSSFCLMNNESILKFVFDWIDTDGDERISKRDIIRATQYRNPRTGQHTFYVNFIPEILRIRVKEGDENDGQSIEFDVFRQFTSRLSFLIWPAFRFQEALRE